MQERELLYLIRGAIYDTYNALGSGMLESLYEDALELFLKKRNLKVARQVEIPVYVENIQLKSRLRLDMIVEDKIIIELKSVDDMRDIFHHQIVSYIKTANVHRGILVNFNTTDINTSIWYKINSNASFENTIHPVSFYK